MYPGKLPKLDEDVEPEQVLKNRYLSPEMRNATHAENKAVFVNSLKEQDSDEERCDLVDSKNQQDRHFFCQQNVVAELRQRIIDEYLQTHSLQQIPQGIGTNKVDVLLNLHLYLYHRLPSAENMEELKRATFKMAKDRKQEGSSPKKKDKSGEEEVSFIMKFVHCYGKG